MASTLKAAVVSSESSSPELMQRNRELEEELKQSQQREDKMRVELERTEKQLRVVEEAEERLCSHLGDLEAEVFKEVREYRARIVTLTEQLLQANELLQAVAGADADADHDHQEAIKP